MLYWTLYNTHVPKTEGKRKLYDNNIYTFDIETTSFFELYGKIYESREYEKLTKKEQEQCEFYSNMYIWQFGINDEVYYGRTWNDLCLFLTRLNCNIRDKKYVFVHNFSYEFQFLRNIFKFENVFARKKRKVIRAELPLFNIEFRCTLFMSNCSLDKLGKVFNLNLKKKTGDLKYNILRNSKTILSDIELGYCEYDCLCVYEYIKKLLDKYKTIKNIPLTSTGFVRNEFKKIISKNYKYKNKTRKAINVSGHVYNLMLGAFAGRIYTCELDLCR